MNVKPDAQKSALVFIFKIALMAHLSPAMHAKKLKKNVKQDALKLVTKLLYGAKKEEKSHVKKEQRAADTLALYATKKSAQVASLYHVLMAQMSSATDVLKIKKTVRPDAP